MKKFLLILPLLTQISVALDIKPGLWEVNTQFERDGKAYDPQAQIKKAMANMTPEQKKMMEDLMKKSGGTSNPLVGIGKDGQMKICLTKESMDNPQKFLPQGEEKQCDMKFTEKTATKMKADYTCKNGTKGNMEWLAKSKENYETKLVSTTPQGEVSKMNAKAKYVSASCGNVKSL